MADGCMGIAGRRPDDAGSSPLVVGITGGSGSGKTTFARRLCERLESDAVLIAHDDYYLDQADVPYREDAGYDFDCPEALDTPLLVEHLRSLKAGRAVEIPAYDFLTHTRELTARTVEPAPVILLDGLLIMCDPELRGLLDLTVFMDAEPDVRALRRIERDCRERGIGLSEAVDMYLRTVKPAYERYVAPFKAEADIVVSDALDDRALELVVQKAMAAGCGVRRRAGRIVEVRSGGQSGADRGAMDAARDRGVPVSGWCPAGGWAEDLPEPPGVRALYPQMVETPSADVIQRTEWNIRDSTCCVVLNTRLQGTSRGTDAGYVFFEKYGIPRFDFEVDDPATYDEQLERACAWLQGLEDEAIVLGVGGPRASEYPGIYGIAYRVVGVLLDRLAAPSPSK